MSALKGLITLCVVMILCVPNTGLAGLSKSVVQVDPGNTKTTGQTFIYRLTYSCDNTNTDCFGAQVIDNLPPEVQYISHVATSDVDSVNVSGNLITFNMIDPLPAGNSGDLLINVRFPVGSTPNGTVATNTADGGKSGDHSWNHHHTSSGCHRRGHDSGQPQ